MAVGTWLRPVSGFLLGVIVAFSAVALVQRLGHLVFPPPAGLDTSDARAVAAALEQLPVGALLFLVAGWALGSYAGAAVATWIARAPSPLPGLAVGAVVLGATLLTLFNLPHPTWMMMAGALVPLPAAWLGARSIAR
ncbi:MAG: hypothetical protein AAF495_05220 [Pseudomonadota bacterium]